MPYTYLSKSPTHLAHRRGFSKADLKGLHIEGIGSFSDRHENYILGAFFRQDKDVLAIVMRKHKIFACINPNGQKSPAYLNLKALAP